MTMAGPPFYVGDARGYPHGALFFLRGEPGKWQALVYNTIGLSRCPPEQFDAIDVDALRAETGSDVVWKNFRRFCIMDRLTLAPMGEGVDVVAFGGLAFNCVARMQMPASFDPAKGQSGLAYHPGQSNHNSTYEYLGGKPVFLLRSPDAVTWVMYTYTNFVDAGLSQATLPGLGQRLELPAGWDSKAKTLDRNLVLDAQGVTCIVSDDLENLYQGCTEDVRNFDPWE
jgi:hypothetical protein